jgi:hypothetical protein
MSCFSFHPAFLLILPVIREILILKKRTLILYVIICLGREQARLTLRFRFGCLSKHEEDKKKGLLTYFDSKFNGTAKQVQYIEVFSLTRKPFLKEKNGAIEQDIDQ